MTCDEPSQHTAVFTAVSSLRESAAQLAQHLSLPLADEPDGRFSYLLVLTRERLELHSQGPFAPGPVYVDFTQGKLAYRRRLGGGRQQALARAVGLKGGYVPDVLDATAGLGGDSFVLACLGCQVRMVERLACCRIAAARWAGTRDFGPGDRRAGANPITSSHHRQSGADA